MIDIVKEITRVFKHYSHATGKLGWIGAQLSDEDAAIVGICPQRKRLIEATDRLATIDCCLLCRFIINHYYRDHLLCKGKSSSKRGEN